MKVQPARLLAARKRARLTQRELAEAIGVTVQAVSQWENGKTDASPRINALCEILQCSSDYLTGNIETEKTIRNSTANKDRVIDVISIDDLSAYLPTDIENRSKFRLTVITTNTQPVGNLFAIEVRHTSDHFGSGDLLIFDDGIKPVEGDYAAMIVLGEKGGRISFTDGVAMRIKGAVGVVTQLVDGPFETFEPAPILLDPKVAADAERGPMILAGTLVERRIFRKSGTAT